MLIWFLCARKYIPKYEVPLKLFEETSFLWHKIPKQNETKPNECESNSWNILWMKFFNNIYFQYECMLKWSEVSGMTGDLHILINMQIRARRVRFGPKHVWNKSIWSTNFFFSFCTSHQYDTNFVFHPSIFYSFCILSSWVVLSSIIIMKYSRIVLERISLRIHFGWMTSKISGNHIQYINAINSNTSQHRTGNMWWMIFILDFLALDLLVELNVSSA